MLSELERGDIYIKMPHTRRETRSDARSERTVHVIRGRKRSCRRQADGRAGPNAGRIAGPAPGLAERVLRPEVASFQGMPLQDQHSTLEQRAASHATGSAQPLVIVTT